MGADLVGIAEIAEMVGASRQSIVNLRTRRKDFPAPVAKLRCGPIFHRDHVRQWFEQNGRSSLMKLIKKRIVLSAVFALCSTACLADSSVVADDQPEEALDVDAGAIEKVVFVCPLGAPICIYIDVDDGACPWQGCDPWPKPPPPLADEVDGGAEAIEGDSSGIFVPICPGAPWCPPLPLPPCPYIGHPGEGKTCRGPNGPVMPPTWPGPSLAPGDDSPPDEPGPTDTTG